MLDRQLNLRTCIVFSSGCPQTDVVGQEWDYWSQHSEAINIRTILLCLFSVASALVVLTMLLGAGVYESVVVAPNFPGCADIL